MSTETYANRNAMHEMAARRLDATFRRMGFTVAPWGVEADGKRIAELLRERYSPTARMVRYRPDRLVISDQHEFLVEIKTEDGRYGNFAVEIDSYAAAHQYMKGGASVFYVFSDPIMDRACWAQEIVFDTIYVPSRWGSETMERLKSEWPGKRLVLRDWGSGASGTPYFLIRKNARILQPLEEFLQDILRGQVVVHPAPVVVSIHNLVVANTVSNSRIVQVVKPTRNAKKKFMPAGQQQLFHADAA